jgi:DNA-binding CsgD family transcriptional regulator
MGSNSAWKYSKASKTDNEVEKMTTTTDENATILAVGIISLDYLNSVFSGYTIAIARYPIAPSLSPTFNLAAVAAAKLTANTSTGELDVAQLGPPIKQKGADATKRGAEQTVTVKQASELSEREKSRWSWTALGKSSWEIGRILRISENTVIFHIKNAMRKLGTSSRTLAAIKAIQLGIIESEFSADH